MEATQKDVNAQNKIYNGCVYLLVWTSRIDRDLFVLTGIESIHLAV
jgi:hypothetical protein